MKVRLATPDLSTPRVIDDLGSIVVYDDFGAPILLVQKMVQGLVLTYTPNDPQFAVAMKTLGIGLNSRYTKVETNGSRKAIAVPQSA